MWWGVLLGFLGLGAGFFGLRRASIIEGRAEERTRHRRYADMIKQEMLKQDQLIDKKTEANVQLVRRTTRRRLKTKTAKSARSFLSRTKKPW